MTRLLNPTIGEIVDRMTILELKIEHGQGKVDTGGWSTEMSQLMSLVKGLTTAAGDTADKLVSLEHAYGQVLLTLREINSGLWKMEDEVRTLRDPGDPKCRVPELMRLASLAKTISRLNDARMAEVSRLNVAFGTSGEQKLYGGTHDHQEPH